MMAGWWWTAGQPAGAPRSRTVLGGSPDLGAGWDGRVQVADDGTVVAQGRSAESQPGEQAGWSTRTWPRTEGATA